MQKKGRVFSGARPTGRQSRGSERRRIEKPGAVWPVFDGQVV